MNEIAEAKSRVRSRIRTARRAMDEESRRSQTDQLRAVLELHVPPAARVAAYLAMPAEPDVGGFLHRHLDRGGEVFIPRVADDPDPHLEWVPWTSQAPTRRHPVLPLQEPVGEAIPLQQVLEKCSEDEPLLMLLPALAVDSHGHRLGQGGGYYDRLFAELRGVDSLEALTSWAVVGAEEVLQVGEFPVEDHDLEVDAVISPDGLKELP